MHNNTHSVHKRLFVMWRARLPCFEPFRYVYPPPLSEANCPPFPPPGGPGPPASKMAPFSPGSTHTPSIPSVTVSAGNYDDDNPFRRIFLPPSLTVPRAPPWRPAGDRTCIYKNAIGTLFNFSSFCFYTVFHAVPADVCVSHACCRLYFRVAVANGVY
jgi:hypothetical protein